MESADERAAFLDKSCGNNLELRRQLEKLLQSDQQVGSFLEKPHEGLDATMVQESSVENVPGKNMPGKRVAASMNAGLTAAFSVDEAVVVGDKNHSVLKMLGNTMAEVPHVSLREPTTKGAEPISRPSSPEMPDKDSNNRYQLQGEIARGGMGAILKGRDTDLGRDLAIKVLLDSHKDNPEVIQRFVEEAQIGGQLQHPGIAPIYELGQFADKRPFFAMKLVKGQTFSKLLKERDDPADDRGRFIGIFEQVCQTMAYAHSRGVIHRDLKPANIMVGAFGEVQVMDWGLAKVLPAGGIEDEKQAHNKHKDVSIIQTIRSGVGSDPPGVIGSFGSQTQMGSVMGTPAYMPPEQALGEIDQMDERADVFGLGAILCEILTGKPPYVADDGTRVFRMASRGKLDECFERLDACGADEDLIALTKHCLELEPADRPRDAEAAAQRVTGYLESVESKLRESEVERAAEAARADAEAAQSAAEKLRAEAEAAQAQAERQRAEAEHDRAETEAKRLVQQQHSARKLKKMLTGLAALALLAVGASIVAGSYWKAAEDARAEAVETRGKALKDWYIADMNHAGFEASTGNFELTVELLKRHLPSEGQEDLRGLEWYLMWKKIQAGLLAKTVQLPVDVRRLAISPDQKTAAIGGVTRGVYFIDLETQSEPVLAIPGSTEPIEFSPSGAFIAAVARTEPNNASLKATWKIELWDVSKIESGEDSNPVAIFPLEHRPDDIAFSSDGSLLASCTRNTAQIRFWRRSEQNRQPVNYTELPSISLPNYVSDGIERISFALDGKMLAYSSPETAIGVLTLTEMDWVRPISIEDEELIQSGFPLRFAVTPDGTRLAYSMQARIVVRDLATGQSLHTVDADDEVSGLRWSHDGRRLISAQDDNSVLVWDFNQKTRHRVWGHSRKVFAMAIIQPEGADCPCMITANQERIMKYWQLDSAHGFAVDEFLGCDAFANATGRSETILAYRDGTVASWILGSTDPPTPLFQHSTGVSQLAYSSKGTVASMSKAEIRLWNPVTRRDVVLDANPEASRTCALRFSENGETLASFHEDRIKVWDVAQRSLNRILHHDSTVTTEGGVFLLGTTQILSDSEVGNNHLCLWDYGLKVSQPTLVTRRPMGDMMWGRTGFSVDPSTGWVAVASLQGIRILDPETLESIRFWKSHGGRVDSVAYASKLGTLASSGLDGQLRLWDATTFEPKLSLSATRRASPWSGRSNAQGLSFVGDNSALCLERGSRLRIWQIAREADVKAAGW
ncbi:WD40 repeat domain-containing serine/threonine protein kinase [Planctomycetaceae bacterium SH139]